MADKRITDLPLILSGDLSSNDVLPIVDVDLDITNKIEVNQLKSYILSGLSDNYVTGGTYSGGTLVLNTQEGNITISGFTEPFSGGSGNCITDLYITNLHGCSPITVNDNLIMTTGTTISSLNGGGQIDLDYNGNPNEVLLTTDNANQNESGLYVRPTAVELFTKGYDAGFYLGSTLSEWWNQSDVEEDTTIQITVGPNRAIWLREITTKSVTQVQGVFPSAVFINSSNSTFISGVTNSVILGGVNMTADTSNTVYVPNLNIKTIGSGTSIYNLGIDSTGNVVSGTTGGGYTYEIGQYVEDEGGVIAHRWLSTTALGSPEAGTFQNYLVVDIDDLSSGAPFTIGPPPISPTYYNKWDGNTNCINFTALGGAVSGTAIYLCNISENQGKNDWYLPAIDELSKIWHNRWEIGQGLANAGGTQLVSINSYDNSTDYLSSTSQGETVYLLKPFFGYVYQNDTANSYYVRAVRKFSL